MAAKVMVFGFGFDVDAQNRWAQKIEDEMRTLNILK